MVWKPVKGKMFNTSRALKCISFAAQKLRRIYLTRSQNKTAILNTITINNPKEMIGVTDKNKKNMAYF